MRAPMRSQSPSASSIECVVSSTARRRLASSTHSQSVRRDAGSSPAAARSFRGHGRGDIGYLERKQVRREGGRLQKGGALGEYVVHTGCTQQEPVRGKYVGVRSGELIKARIGRTGGGLVEVAHEGVAHQRDGDGEPPLHPPCRAAASALPLATALRPSHGHGPVNCFA